MRRWTKSVAEGVLAVGAWCLLAGLQGAGASPPPAAGQAAPSGVDMAGKSVDPLSLAAGKPLVLIYVRSDCPISNRYAPTLKSLGQKYAGKAEFVLVYADKTETVENIQRHMQEFGYQFPPLRDPNHELVKLGQVEITPEAAVFNGNGELIYHGRIDNWYKDFGKPRSAPTTHELDEAVQAALTGGPPPTPVGGIGCYLSDLR